MSNQDRNKLTGGLERLFKIMPRAPRAVSVLILASDGLVGEQLATTLAPVALVSFASSVEAALTNSETYQPDILVFDCDDPGVPLWHDLVLLHVTPALRHCLILVLTTRAGINDKVAAFEAGADDYLVKPVSPEQLRFHVQRLSRFRQVLRPL